ncbi:MAG: hypothetical protein LAP87_18420 [Acidobacteriia bacterium]|nr:hypothetical protein [Terriglobia bacterium]
MGETDQRYPVIARVCASGIWESTSPLHIGGDGDFESNTDMALARDFAGRPYIPGASIAGAVRSHLSRVLSTSFKEFLGGTEKAGVTGTFGGKVIRGRNDAVYASLISVEEGRFQQGPAARIRDGVKINSQTGNAEPKGKYDWEVLPAGTAFCLGFQLLLYEQPPVGITNPEARQVLRWILESFGERGVQLGAKVRKGFGRGAVSSWQIRDYDLHDRAQALDWLEHRGSQGGRELPLEDLGPVPLPSVVDRLTIEAEFHVRTSLLVRAASEEEGGPDVTQFSENGRMILPGTAVAGALRHRIERIANTLGNVGRDFVVNLFGIANQPGTPERAGRLRVDEAPLSGGSLAVQSRVSIDRFTGGSLESRLFDEAPFRGDPNAERHLAIRLELDDPNPREAQILLGAFKDLWLGDLTLGGESSVGRGVLQGIRARFRGPGEQLDMTWDRDPADRNCVETRGAEPWRQYLSEAPNA